MVLLGGIFKRAQEIWKLPQNPVANIERLTVPQRAEIEFYEPEEVDHPVDHELGVVGGKMPSALLRDVAECQVEELLLGFACECGEDDETGVDGVGFAEPAEVAVVVCHEGSILLDAAHQDLDV